MRVPKFMRLLHVSFLLLGLLSLLLIAVRIISFDLSAFLVTIVAVFLNAVFAFLWAGEIEKKEVEKKELLPKIGHVFPMVSFVVPAYNQEQNIIECVNSLFRCAVKYRGPSEIVVVDDGSADNTYEAAWTAVASKQRQLPDVRARVVKHLASLGKVEAMRTGVNKAMGEYIAIVEANTVCDPTELADLVDYICASQREAVKGIIYPPHKAVTATQGVIRLYRADALRQLLNQRQMNSATENSDSILKV